MAERSCGVCKQTDDHPRHVVALPGDQFQVRHLDCCAAAGCGVCTSTEAATDGQRGDKLLTAIQAGALEGVEVGEF